MPPASTRPGLGAMPYPGGVSFRVWAPFAPDVFVAGDFNGWSEAASPLTSEGNGYWSLDVPGATIGQKYKFRVGGQLRIDPLVGCGGDFQNPGQTTSHQPRK